MLGLFRGLGNRFRAHADVPFLFVHIPKTAGTSFRIAFERRYRDAVLADYGAEAAETNSLIKRHMYQNSEDLCALGRSIFAKPFRLIAGHDPIYKYLKLSRLDRVVVFYRDPVQRVVSEWEHRRRIFGYSGSLTSFVRDPRFQNYQSRLLGQIPLELIGFNLITEHYRKSLDLFNAETGFAVEAIRVNQNESRRGDRYELSPEDENLIRELNQEDQTIYDKASRLFHERIRLSERSRGNWTYGGLDGTTNGEWITGYAYQRSLKPVEIQVLVEGQVIAETRTGKRRRDLQSWSVPRRGCIGFRVHLPKEHRNSGKPVTCRVKPTGQVLGDVTWAESPRKEKIAA